MTWHRALSLAERGQPGPIRGEAAAGRIGRWKASFASESALLRRLETEALTVSALDALLGEPDEALERRVPLPAFAVAVEKALAAPVDPGIDERLDARLPRGAAFEAACARMARPFLRVALGRIDEATRMLPRRDVFEENIGDELIAECPRMLAPLFEGTLALEVNAARLENALQGESPEARFDDFVATMTAGPRLAAFYGEYPALARLVHERVHDFTDAAIELLARLHEDADAIRERFHDCAAPLGSVGFGAGDVHRRGRSVCVLAFGSARLVYKPRSVGVEAHFQELLAWLNQRGAGRVPELRTTRVLPREAYGYVEYIEHRHAQTPDDVARFYVRQGAYLALFHALGATDLHSENVIAQGEHPFIVDLETLFQGGLAPDAAAGAAAGRLDPAVRAIEHSVLRTSMLPERRFSSDGSGFDVSGMGHVAGQVAPHALSRMTGPGTDEMRLVPERALLGPSRALPSPQVSPAEHVEDVCRGFRALYGLLLASRASFLDHLEAFRGDETRILVADTMGYEGLLRASLHPQYLRDALERERIFNRLWSKLAQRPALLPLIASEREDLERGNLPYFSARADSRSVRDSRGRAFDGVLERSGFDAATDRVRSLSPLDLEAQEWVIRASFATVPLAEVAAAKLGPPSTPHPAARFATTDELLAAARSMGDRLVRSAHRHGGHAGWLGLSQVGERAWRVAPVDVSLYDGLSGMCLFLAHLGAVTEHGPYTELARETLATIRIHTQRPSPAAGRSRSARPHISGYAERGAPIYLLAHLARLWADASLAAEGQALADELGPAIEEDDELDFMNGSAGYACAVLALHAVAPSSGLLALARRAADHLVTRASPLPEGLVAWSSPRASAPLTGLAHGAAGMALSLLRVAAAVESAGHDGARTYRDHARRAFAYERSVFSHEHRNWPDLRAAQAGPSPPPARFAVTWCHGAPGIGLSRVEAARLGADDPLVARDLEAALATTAARGFGANHSLCHGDLGNLELLLHAADQRLTDDVRHRAATVLDCLSLEGPRCGTPLAVETPGLMTGLAGIGYAFLRLAAPARVPSVLTLQIPSEP